MTSLAIVNMTDSQGGWGSIIYSGITIGPFRNFELHATPIYDEAGRTTIATEYRLRVHAFVVGSTTGSPSANVAASSVTMNALRTKLLMAGQSLQLINLGIGDIVINASSGNTFSDIAYGPKPQSLSITNVGGCTAFEIVWEISFQIKECSATPTGQLVAFNYSATYQIDEAGLTTRSIEGYMQVPMSRASVGNNSADKKRGQYINVAVPSGFQRIMQVYRLSPDRTREDFAIADRQLDSTEGMPKYCVNANIDFDIQNVRPGFATWEASLTGELEVVAGAPMSAAPTAFILIALDRWSQLQSVAQAQGGVVIPSTIRWGRTLFHRRARFGMTWMIAGACLTDLLQQGGVWQPLTGMDVNTWAGTMASAWSQRGVANLVYSPSSDAIVDLCGGVPSDIADLSSPNTAASGSGSPFSCNNIPQKNSWLGYSNRLVASQSRDYSVHKLATGYTPGTSSGASTNASSDATNLGTQITQPYTDVTQDKSIPTQYVRMIGKALRVQYRPSIPTLVAVGGQAVEEVDRIVDGPRLVGCIFGCPVYSVRWNILYKPKSSTLFDLKSSAEQNPMMCCAPTTSP